MPVSEMTLLRNKQSRGLRHQSPNTSSAAQNRVESNEADKSSFNKRSGAFPHFDKVPKFRFSNKPIREDEDSGAGRGKV